MIENIKKDDFDNLIKEHENVIVDFYADWCSPCKMVSQHLESTQELLKNVKIVKFNIEHDKDFAYSFGVRSIPFFIFIKDGKVLSSHAGFLSQLQLVDKANSLFN